MPKRKNKQYEREQKAIADRKELILKLYTVDGRKQSEIADMFRMSRSRVNEIIQKAGVDGCKSEEPQHDELPFSTFRDMSVAEAASILCPKAVKESGIDNEEVAL